VAVVTLGLHAGVLLRSPDAGLTLSMAALAAVAVGGVWAAQRGTGAAQRGTGATQRGTGAPRPRTGGPR